LRFDRIDGFVDDLLARATTTDDVVIFVAAGRNVVVFSITIEVDCRRSIII
jgi:hypothetical protein